jgi:signal transduction histidine kinase
MQQAAGRMNTLLEDLLDTSKIDAGRYTIKPQALDVGQMFEETQSLLGPLALDKDISMSFRPTPTCKSMPTRSACFRCCRT